MGDRTDDLREALYFALSSDYEIESADYRRAAGLLVHLGYVPLADVLDALRDHDGFVDWTRTKGPQGYIDDYVIRQYREACARYLAERFAPTTAPEGEKPWPGLPTPGLHLVTVEDMNTCVRCGKFTGRADCPGDTAPEGADERNGHGHG